MTVLPVLDVLEGVVVRGVAGQRAEYRPLRSRLVESAVPLDVARALREPAMAHGVRANRAVLETAAAYSVEQGLTPRLVRIDELFAESTLNQ